MIVSLPAPHPLGWSLARPGDGAAIAELRAAVLRDALEQLDRYDDLRVREYFLSAFMPEHTRVLRTPDGIVGSIALRPAPDGTWIEHFYLHHDLQGSGLGTAVLLAITSTADAAATTLRLNVLQRSQARRLYERHGFAFDREDSTDVYLVRSPRG